MESPENFEPKTLSTMPKGEYTTESEQIDANFEKEQARQIREEVFAYLRSEEGKHMLETDSIVDDENFFYTIRERLAEKLNYFEKFGKFFDDNGNDKTASIVESYPSDVIKKVLEDCRRSILGEGENN